MSPVPPSPPAAAMAGYVRRAALALILGLAAIAAFNAAVDPYGIVGAPLWPGLNTEKPAASERQTLSKTYRLDALQPRTLLIGSSALNIGIDPASVAWPASDRPVYNLGIDGAPLEIQKRFLLHALAVTHLSRVVIFTSFEDAVASPAGWAATNAGATDDVRRMRVTEDGAANPLLWKARLSDAAFALLSLAATRDSLATLANQGAQAANSQNGQGFERRRSLEDWARREGPAPLLQTSVKMRLTTLSALGTRTDVHMATLSDMVRAAREHGARVDIVIQPAYVLGLELRRQLGFDRQAEAWLEDTVRAARTIAVETGDPASVTVWDFGGYTRYNQGGPDPAAPDADPHHWFYEAIHFKPRLGTLMLDQLVAGTATTDLGEKVTVDNVATLAARFEAGQASWVASHPADVAAVARLLREAYASICPPSRPCRLKAPS